jgi:hypothetical protein
MGVQRRGDSYSAQLVACLHTVSHRHSTALLASDGYGQMPVFEYGENAVDTARTASAKLRDKIAIIHFAGEPLCRPRTPCT